MIRIAGTVGNAKSNSDDTDAPAGFKYICTSCAYWIESYSIEK